MISDLVTQDPKWCEWSLSELSKPERRFMVNPVIYSELCCRAESHTEVDTLLTELQIDYCELPRKALFLAGQAFVRYRKRGGTKSAPLPDFYIGAHAASLGISIVTRYASRYRTYFPKIKLICP